MMARIGELRDLVGGLRNTIKRSRRRECGVQPRDSENSREVLAEVPLLQLERSSGVFRSSGRGRIAAHLLRQGIEPTPGTSSYLRETFRLQGSAQMSVPVGKEEFSFPGSEIAMPSRLLPVSQVDGAALQRRRLDSVVVVLGFMSRLIKLDVEGAELSSPQRAKYALSEHRRLAVAKEPHEPMPQKFRSSIDELREFLYGSKYPLVLFGMPSVGLNNDVLVMPSERI